MKSAEFLSALSLVFLLSAGSAYAQDPGEDPGDEGEMTIRLIPDPDTDLPGAVTKPIALPDAASGGEGVMNSAAGLAMAAGRLQRRQDGLDTAAAARADGRAFGAAMVEAAQADRANLSRANASDLPTPPDLPNLPPDGPNPPGQPNPPGPRGP